MNMGMKHENGMAKEKRRHEPRNTDMRIGVVVTSSDGINGNQATSTSSAGSSSPTTTDSASFDYSTFTQTFTDDNSSANMSMYTTTATQNGGGAFTIVIAISTVQPPTSTALPTNNSTLNSTALPTGSLNATSSMNITSSLPISTSSLLPTSSNSSAIAFPTGVNSTQGTTTSNRDLSGGAIAGIVVGSVVGLLALLALLFFLFKRRSDRAREDSITDMMAPSARMDPYGGHAGPESSMRFSEEHDGPMMSESRGHY